jgi:hypothetical protein
MRPDTAFFEMSTNSVATVRKIHAAFAEGQSPRPTRHPREEDVSTAARQRAAGCTRPTTM